MATKEKQSCLNLCDFFIDQGERKRRIPIEREEECKSEKKRTWNCLGQKLACRREMGGGHAAVPEGKLSVSKGK